MQFLHRDSEQSVDPGFSNGLLPAALILFAAAVGGVALSQLVLAVGVTAFVLVTLRSVGFVQRRLEKQQR